ncbi:MAG TPA: vitamin K epoxide reductase family protein [Tepidisphaeraceae bacterium]|jgi:uncharacterized membrane protein|nr:vitamin K epoxide reductase family protein [Tepidisphaeraceae bacterium]
MAQHWLELTGSFFAAAAAVLSLLIARQSTGAAGLPGCGAASACDAVTQSRWSKIGRVPVALPGALLYLAMLAAALAIALSARQSSILPVIGRVAAWVTIGSAAWFLALQALVVRRFCLYCVAIHTLAVVAALILLFRLPASDISSTSLALGAAGLLGILVGGQLLIPVRMFDIQNAAAPAHPRTIAASAAPVSISQPHIPQAPAIPIRRRVSLYSGRVELDMQEWPVLGAAAGDHVIAWLFDHTCAECHHEHRLLRRVLPMFGDDLAIIAVPVPMFPDCNPEAKGRYESQVQACAYARLSWALWLAAPNLYDQWDAFMAESDVPQPFGLAMQKAASLADLGQFNIRSRDGHLDARLAMGVDVYRRCGVEKVPVLLLPRGIGRGHVQTAEKLYSALRGHLPPRVGGNAMQT